MPPGPPQPTIKTVTLYRGQCRLDHKTLIGVFARSDLTVMVVEGPDYPATGALAGAMLGTVVPGLGGILGASVGSFLRSYWIVRVAVGGSLGSFFVAIGGAAGKDTYDGIKTLVRSLRAAANSKHGFITFTGDEGTAITLWAHLPDEAFEQLETIDWSGVQGGSLIWDSDTCEWVHNPE